MIDLIIFFLIRAISLYALIMLVYCLAGWFIRDPSNKFMAGLGKITEPLLDPIRQLLWKADFFRNSPVDFSPLILFFLLQIVVRALAEFSRFV